MGFIREGRLDKRCTRALACHSSLAIHQHIAKDSPRYAARIIERLTDRIGQLKVLPESGIKVQEYRNPSIRQLIERPYRIIYRTSTDQIDVLAVIHGARDLRRIDLEGE